MEGIILLEKTNIYLTIVVLIIAIVLLLILKKSRGKNERIYSFISVCVVGFALFFYTFFYLISIKLFSFLIEIDWEFDKIPFTKILTSPKFYAELATFATLAGFFQLILDQHLILKKDKIQNSVTNELNKLKKTLKMEKEENRLKQKLLNHYTKKYNEQ